MRPQPTPVPNNGLEEIMSIVRTFAFVKAEAFASEHKAKNAAMLGSMGWVILHKRYGEEVRQPLPSELAQAIGELFDENIEGMAEADYAEHPNAWLRYGFDEGPMFVVEASRNGTATLSKYADQDDIDPVAEVTFSVERGPLLSLWLWLAEGELERIRSAYPRCGW